jgi:hypothetical protein
MGDQSRAYFLVMAEKDLERFEFPEPHSDDAEKYIADRSGSAPAPGLSRLIKGVRKQRSLPQGWGYQDEI